MKRLMFKSLIINIIYISLLFSWANSFAQAPGFSSVKDIDGLKRVLKEKHQTTKTIKSNFVQEKHLSFMKDKSVSKGTMQIKEGKKIRIDYTSPFSYIIVINGDRLYIKDGKKLTKINIGADKTFSNLNDILLGSIKGDFDSSKEFTIKYFENKESFLLELLPADLTKGNFSAINIYLNRENLNVAKLEMNEKSGDITKMKFDKTEINSKIADEVFVVR
ncbi:MAG: outer membrane lipoprotein carrier protein LolA [Opitutaceae bacterium]|nr:outer membrane lipoprotein carrier protein LolA [Cytophagales bacterium]